jgi:hypothetical protein
MLPAPTRRDAAGTQRSELRGASSRSLVWATRQRARATRSARRPRLLGEMLANPSSYIMSRGGGRGASSTTELSPHGDSDVHLQEEPLEAPSDRPPVSSRAVNGPSLITTPFVGCNRQGRTRPMSTKRHTYERRRRLRAGMRRPTRASANRPSHGHGFIANTSAQIDQTAPTPCQMRPHQSILSMRRQLGVTADSPPRVGRPRGALCVTAARGPYPDQAMHDSATRTPHRGEEFDVFSLIRVQIRFGHRKRGVADFTPAAAGRKGFCSHFVATSAYGPTSRKRKTPA